MTEAAVRAFRITLGLVLDGEVGNERAKALGIETHEHHEYKGVNKGKIKAQIKGLKKDRDAAIEKKEYAELKKIRNEIKKLKNKLKRAMV